MEQRFDPPGVMTTIDPLPPLREVIRRHGLRAKKSLGQNFLLDLNLTRKIARSAGSLEDATIIEVGPGPGGLTRALLMEGARQVVAIERDERCLVALQEVAECYPGRLSVLHGDALEMDTAALVAEVVKSGPVRVVANLPYGIATPLLTGWITGEAWPPGWASMTLMFQREVADRIVAVPGNRVYGRLGVLAQWRCVTGIAMTLPAAAFTPSPKVDSAVVQFAPRDEPLAVPSVASLERVTAAAFGQRRKMLRASLRRLAGDAEALLREAGIAPTLRAENLSVADFCRLATLFDRGGEGVGKP